MKKLIVAMLCLTALLTGCGADPQPTETTTQPTTQTEATTEAPTETTEAPTEETTEGPSLKAQAESCIGKTVEELIALIGEPQSSDYAPSCLNPGVGEDGNLYYEGFTVYTYKEDGVEEVVDVE
mgnify:CR=1 FL=1